MSGFSDYVNLCENEGYRVDRDLHVSRNGNLIQLAD